MFDYREFVPSAAYFSGHTRVEIDLLCNTGKNASTSDLEVCGERRFEQTSAELEVTVKSIEKAYRNGDVALKADDDPIASAYFVKAQKAWQDYRENQCYVETYSLAVASMRYMTFWDCMARIAKERIIDLQSIGN
ncbi:Uncharacterized conserved protein YecT, DUF1311 family [Paraburkholderia fungorum]|uniref:Uncharacterized conserved protein YecT, DUF1311 family n=1 Tax=Paraburkholderia fungorum TaxID=134537 RepID=A0A1H1JMD7_9BURK|nr:Uncharacterized conserved protein YecT, DUF1311 family [Paraburkholderia fungorum]